MDAQQFGAFISKKRKDNNLTQKELAEKLMVTDKAISRWENGHGFPDIETLEPLAKELGVSLIELMHSKEGTETTSTKEANLAIQETIWISLEARRKKERRLYALFGVVGCVVIICLFLLVFCQI